jgi:hypothetical protein
MHVHCVVNAIALSPLLGVMSVHLIETNNPRIALRSEG